MEERNRLTSQNHVLSSRNRYHCIQLRKTNQKGFISTLQSTIFKKGSCDHVVYISSDSHCWHLGLEQIREHRYITKLFQKSRNRSQIDTMWDSFGYWAQCYTCIVSWRYLMNLLTKIIFSFNIMIFAPSMHVHCSLQLHLSRIFIFSQFLQ